MRLRDGVHQGVHHCVKVITDKRLFKGDFCATAKAQFVARRITGFIPPANYTSIGVTVGWEAQKALLSWLPAISFSLMRGPPGRHRSPWGRAWLSISDWARSSNPASFLILVMLANPKFLLILGEIFSILVCAFPYSL